MKKILFIQPGYAHYRDDLFNILSQRYNIHFLFGRSKNTYPGEGKPIEIVHTFLDKKCKNISVALIYCLLKFDFDIIVASGSKSLQTIIAFVFAILFHKKFILWTLEWRNPSYNKAYIKNVIHKAMCLISKIILLKSHALVVGGSAARKYALSLGKKNKDIFIAFQCSKDIDYQKGFIIDRRVKKKKYTFLFLSRIINMKGLDKLIAAFYLLKQKRDDTCLLIAGDGPARQYCCNLTESLGVPDIQFFGSIDPKNTKSIYAKADVFVLPSYELDACYEAWGLVINEAMSAGLPVITTTAVAASFDMITDGFNGFVVQENNIVALYRAMDKILKCNLFQMGTNSRRIFDEKNHYWKMANGFFDAFAYVE